MPLSRHLFGQVLFEDLDLFKSQLASIAVKLSLVMFHRVSVEAMAVEDLRVGDLDSAQVAHYTTAHYKKNNHVRHRLKMLPRKCYRFRPYRL